MKKIPFLLIFLAVSALACKEKTASTGSTATNELTDNGGSQDHPDLVAINEVIHNFYKWYETNEKALQEITYVKGGKSTTLDQTKLDAYHALLKSSGCISQSYIDADRAYLKNLEATAWKTENFEETPLTGLDFERLFCAQDWDIEQWKTAPIAADGLETDKSVATMSTEEGGSLHQRFELVKENGKWLISSIICEE
jgi:hypothetical protein